MSWVRFSPGFQHSEFDAGCDGVGERVLVKEKKLSSRAGMGLGPSP